MADVSIMKRHGSMEGRVEAFSFVIAVVICMLLCGYLAGGMKASESETTLELQSRINPNTASAASLARLPGIGLVRAQAIAAYRDTAAETAPGKSVFKNGADMEKVRGIGPKTVENMSEWLIFE